MHKWVSLCAVAIVFFKLPAVWGQSLAPQPYDFSFTAVEGAGGYLVEVRDATGKIVVSHAIKADQTDVSLSLVPGSYELRLTTLNRLQHAESATDWMPIHVAAASPPTVSSMAAQTIVTGKAQSVSLKVQGLAIDAVASLKSPSGTVIPVSIRLNRDGTFDLQTPSLTQAGSYQVIITNPPNLSLIVKDKLTVSYPQPIITHLDPASLEQGVEIANLNLSGQDFSPEVVVSLQPAMGERIPLEVTKSASFGITARIPSSLGVGQYEVIVANSTSMAGVNVGTVTIVSSVKTPTMTLHHYYGSIAVRAQSQGNLYLDGKKMGDISAGDNIELDQVEAGTHTVFVQYKDGEEERQSVVVNNGETATVSFSHTLGALPQKTIDIKGSLDQWNDIPPALFGTSLNKGNVYIDKVYLVVDAQNLYMRFDIKDDRKSSFFHPNNFNTDHRNIAYGLVIWRGDLGSNVEFNYSGGASWRAYVEENHGGGASTILLSVSSFIMKGSTAVAAFPLKPIKDYIGSLGPGDYYKLTAYVWYRDTATGPGDTFDVIRNKVYVF
jgi:plastocyanin